MRCKNTLNVRIGLEAHFTYKISEESFKLSLQPREILPEHFKPAKNKKRL